jgi:hypothetical protein
MAGGVEHHSDLFLWLVGQESGTGVLGLFNCVIESSIAMSRYIIICCSPDAEGHRGRS